VFGHCFVTRLSPDEEKVYACQPYGHKFGKLPVDKETGVLSTVVEYTYQGATDLVFWGDFVYLVGWGNATTPRTIQTRSKINNDFGDDPLFETAGYVGMYTLDFVEIWG
jgi:hypothetical protein